MSAQTKLSDGAAVNAESAAKLVSELTTTLCRLLDRKLYGDAATVELAKCWIERHATPQTQATHGEGEATLLPDMLRASIADTEFAVQVIRDLCPEGIEDQCDECGGDPARCHEVQPNCPYPRARLLIAATHPAPSPTADLDRE